MKSIYFTFFALFLTCHAFTQTTVVINCSRDNTIYSENSNSNGIGENTFAGATQNSDIRRNLSYFNVGSVVPSGATITSVTVSYFCNRSISGSQPVSFHKLTSNWGEGSSDAAGNEGGGIAATINDATWTNNFFPSSTWGTLGGDFVSTASATTNVNNSGVTYTWSSAALVQDVQSWVNAPATNFGWVLIGNEAGGPGTSKRFASRENPTISFRPTMSVTYSAPLPIKLSAFYLQSKANNVLVHWTTLEEINHDYFSIERSKDGVLFVEVAKKYSSNNSSSIKNYTYNDIDLASGKYYYRLGSHDRDGSTTYSSIENISLKGMNANLLISPNPVSSTLNIRNFDVSKNTSYIVYDSRARTVIKGNSNTGRIDVSSLIPGVYAIKLIGEDNEISTLQFTKY